MKNQALFSIDKSKKLKCRLLQFLLGALRVKVNGYSFKGNNYAVFTSVSFLNWGSTFKEKNLLQ